MAIEALPRPNAGLLVTEEAAARSRLPQLRPGLVYRAALVNRLRVEQAPVVLVTAATGYGKSTLLAQWAGRDGREFRWVGFQPEDGNDPLLVPGLVTAAVCGDSEDDASRYAAEPRLALQRLRRFLQSQASPLVIVLDEVEHIVSPLAIRFLASLCDQATSSVKIVVSGRTVAPKLVGRARAEYRLAELAFHDLRLSDREALALLRGAGIELDVDDAREVNERAEGWAAGVFLAGLGLATRQRGVVRTVRDLGGGHHFLAEYFESEVFARLSPEAMTFAMRAALLERIDGPTCAAVFGDARSLAELLDEGAFLVPTNRERTEFRYHRFFRDALLRKFEYEAPADYGECSRSLARWHEEGGDLAAAIGSLRAIGDRRGALRLLGLLAPDVFGRGLLGPVLPSLSDLRDETLLREDPAGAVTGAFAHALLGYEPEVERWAGAAAGSAVPDPAGDVAAWTRLLDAARCRDGVRRMLDDARAAAGVPAPHVAAAASQLLLGVAELLEGDAGAAERTLQEAVEHAVHQDAWLIVSIGYAELSLLAQSKDLWSVADDLARRAAEAAARFDSEPHAGAALAHVACARSALRNSDWTRAGNEIDRVHLLLPRLTTALPWLSGQVRLELARVHLALNDLAGAAELAEDLGRLLLARPHLGTLRAAAVDLRRQIGELSDHPSGRASTLTAAELRLLPLLTTHLSFRQIADHLYVSRNTVKTQAISVYRKLGVTSRTEAIERAIEYGLLRPEGEVVSRRAS